MSFISTQRGRFSTSLVILLGGAMSAITLLPAASDEFRSIPQAGIVICSRTSPCEEGKNTGKGPGIEGISAKGTGVVGQTDFKSTSSLNAQAGTLGRDAGTGFWNSGVEGTSTNGFGVSAMSTNNFGLYAVGGNDGVVGYSAGANGVFGSSTSGIGVVAQSASGSGLDVQAISGFGAHIYGGSAAASRPTLSIEGNSTNPDLFYACNQTDQFPCEQNHGPAPVFQLTNTGDVFVSGFIYTSGSCSSGCASTHTSGERRVRLFTPQESMPTIEDFGQAQLVSGGAHVRIDPAFANTMQGGAQYMVFLTPQGDNRGLYVTNKTTAGFDVRESQGGRSTIAFDYRVVGKPFGVRATRLRMVTVTRPGTSMPASRLR